MPPASSVRARRQGAQRHRGDKGSATRNSHSQHTTTQRDDKKQHQAEDVLNGKMPSKSHEAANCDTRVAPEPVVEGPTALGGCTGITLTDSSVANKEALDTSTVCALQVGREAGSRGGDVLGEQMDSVSQSVAAASAEVTTVPPASSSEQPYTISASVSTPTGAPSSCRGNANKHGPVVHGSEAQRSGSSAWTSLSGVPPAEVETSGMPANDVWSLAPGSVYGDHDMLPISRNGCNTIDTATAAAEEPLVNAASSEAAASFVCAGEGEPSNLHLAATSHLWLVVFSVLLTWVQDPLLSLLASAAAARLGKGASLAVVSVGAGGQVPDGVCLLLVALGLAVGALCSRLRPSPCDGPLSSRNRRGAAPCHSHGGLPEMSEALRVAAVGAWLAAGVGVLLANFLYTGSESILSFFLSIKGAADAAPRDQEMQQHALPLAVVFLKLRCLSLPCSIVTLTAKAALLTVRDTTPQIATVAAAAAAAPLLFIFSTKASAADTPEAAAAYFTCAAAWAVVMVQVAAALWLLLRLGLLAAAAAETKQHQQRQESSVLRRVQMICWLYRPPQYSEMKAFAPFVLPVLTQCFVRLALYSSMTKAASLWGPKAMAAHQLVAGLYTVLGMPADTMAQVVNAAMPKSTATAPTGIKRMQRRIFKVAACTAVLSAAAQLAVVAFRKLHKQKQHHPVATSRESSGSKRESSGLVTCRLGDTDSELSRTVLFAGGCASIPLLFLPFASTLEGILLRELQGSTVAAAYAATLPAPLLTILAADAAAPETHRKYLKTENPTFVCCLWVLPLFYNIVKLGIMGLRVPRVGSRLALLAKESRVS